MALAYTNFWMVEELFRTTKSILETRPICLKRDEAIRSDVFCSLLDVPLIAELEKRLRERDESWKRAEIIRELENLQELEAVLQGR